MWHYQAISNTMPTPMATPAMKVASLGASTAINSSITICCHPLSWNSLGLLMPDYTSGTAHADYMSGFYPTYKDR